MGALHPQPQLQGLCRTKNTYRNSCLSSDRSWPAGAVLTQAWLAYTYCLLDHASSRPGCYQKLLGKQVAMCNTPALPIVKWKPRGQAFKIQGLWNIVPDLVCLGCSAGLRGTWLEFLSQSQVPER